MFAEAAPPPRPPPPPLRTALLALPGAAAFITLLLFAGCFGATPWGEAASILSGAICALGAVVVTLVSWAPAGGSQDGGGVSLPAGFDERALANALLLAAAVLVWYAAVQWSRRPAIADEGSLRDGLLTPEQGDGSGRSATGAKTGKRQQPTS